jgi:hypothetical protein
VALLETALTPDEDKGRLGRDGEMAEPIVQFLSKEGCFLCEPSCAIGDAKVSPVTEPMSEAVLNSFAELCRE